MSANAAVAKREYDRMKIEGISEGKIKGRPSANEDRLVIAGSNVFSAIDGISDKSGDRYGGRTTGAVAGLLIEEVLVEISRLADPSQVTGSEFVTRCNQHFSRFYRTAGVSDRVQRDARRRLGAQAAVWLRGPTLSRILVIGDCGVRMNARQSFSQKSIIDIINAQVRIACWRHLVAKGFSNETSLEVARTIVRRGLGEDGDLVVPLTREDIEAIGESAFAGCRKVALSAAEPVIRQGMTLGTQGQVQFQNVDHPLGYGALDGYPVPSRFVIEQTLRNDELNCVELYTDGYPVLPNEAAASAWEAAFQRTEALDPSRVHQYPETKGSTATSYADDRSVLIIWP